MGRAYVLKVGDTPEALAQGFVGNPRRAGELIRGNPHLTTPYPVPSFAQSKWIEGALVRIPDNWVSPVISPTSGSVGYKQGGEDTGHAADTGAAVGEGYGSAFGSREDLMTGEQGAPCDIGSDCNVGMKCEISTHTCQPGAEDFLGPCTSAEAIRQVQDVLGVQITGSWNCASQAALAASGKSFKDILNCQGGVPSPCPAGQTCVNGVCSSGVGPVITGGCKADSDCPSGQTCQNGTCSPSVVKASGSSWGLLLALLAAGAGAVGIAWAASKKGRGGAQHNPTGRMSKKDALREFKQFVLPEVVAKYGHYDKPAINEAWNDYTDGLQKDGLITATQYNNWTNPF